MTPRERLLCVLAGNTPDCVPVSPFVQEEYLSYHFKKGDTDRLLDGIALAKELDFDLITRQYLNTVPYFLAKSYENWKVTTTQEVEKGNYYRKMTIETPQGTLHQIEAAPYKKDILSGIHFITMEYFLKTPEDFELFRKYCPAMDQEYEDKLISAGIFAKEAIGNLGINCPWAMGGVYNLVSTYKNVQDMMMDALEDEEYYQQYMNFFADMVAKDYEIMGRTAFDCVGIQGNIANGSMMGESFFADHVLPYEKRTIEVLKKANKPTIYHNCGRAKNLYPCYKELGITVWETVAASPQGDSTLKAAKEYFKNDLILSGNFDQVEFLKTAKEEEVEAAARAQMELGKENGSYIFATSDYLEMGTPLENVKAMIRGAKSVANCF